MTTHDSTRGGGAGIKPYLYTYGALMILLALTVEAARHNLGWFNFPTTMLIATAKAALILWVFMGLDKSTSLTRLFALIGFMWLAILLMGTLADYLTRLPIWVNL